MNARQSASSPLQSGPVIRALTRDGAIVAALTCLIVAVGLTPALMLREWKASVPSQIPFDSSVWKNPGPTTDRLRYRMHEDLLRRYELVGMPREQVVELLGVPRRSSIWPETDMVYNMGIEPGPFAVDNIWLLINLDGQGRVREYRVWTD